MDHINTTVKAPQTYNNKTLFYAFFLTILIVSGIYLLAHFDQAVLHWLQQNEAVLEAKIDAFPFLAPLVFVLGFALVIGFYIPGGIILLLLSGALFAPLQANLLANFGNLIGAVIGFLLSRYLFYNEVQARYGKRLDVVNRGIRQHGGLYLFLLRLAPVMPSPVVNLLMGMTPITLRTYIIATLLGRIPMTALYVNLGAELSLVSSFSEIVSAEIMISLLLVCLLVLVGNHLVRRMER